MINIKIIIIYVVHPVWVNKLTSCTICSESYKESTEGSGVINRRVSSDNFEILIHCSLNEFIVIYSEKKKKTILNV